MSEWRVAGAIADDVTSLEALYRTEFTADFNWRRGVEGPGVILVARDATGQLIGAAAAKAADIEQLPLLSGRRPPRNPPWWKLLVLVVAAQARGTGVGRALLEETVARLPSGTFGLYGNVELNRRSSIEWYRRRGFRISGHADLVERRGAPPQSTARAVPPTDEVMFYADRRRLADFLAGRGSDFELSEARAEYRSELNVLRKARKPRTDTGYRTVAGRVVAAAQRSQATCVHAEFGPRLRHLLAWDPELVAVCVDCFYSRLTVLEANDDATCDNCGSDDGTGEISQVTFDRDLLVVTLNLCEQCRATP